MRENYGNVAIGFVQLIREKDLCIVKAEICPEHRVRKKRYNVSVVVNEAQETVVSATCEDCAAAQGGCKHAVALLAWIYRKSEEPSPTSVECYWKKPALSCVGSNIKYQEIGKLNSTSESISFNEELKVDDFLETILNHPIDKKCNSHIINFYRQSELQQVSMFYQSVSYSGDKKSVLEFKSHSAKFLKPEVCAKVTQETMKQSDSMLWYELRFGRITASILYDAAHCKTPDGTLVEKILSMNSMYYLDTLPMKRGRQLEPLVLKKVKELLKKDYKQTKIAKSGLILKADYFMLGASPDGVTSDAVIEIKCPAKEKSISKYYNNGKITPRYRAQIQLQMLFAGKKKGFFCIADPEFEENNLVSIVEEQFSQKFIDAVIKRAVIFWETNIFPLLMKYTDGISDDKETN